MRRLNRRAGQWLLLRAAPLPDCEAGAGAAEVTGLYRWTDERGVEHFVGDEALVPERHRAGARIRSLPPLTVYRGEFSRLRPGAAGVTPAAPTPRAPEAGARAVVYSAAWCEACKKTKAWLAARGVAVEERDVEKDPAALAELVALAGKDPAIPVTVIGRKVVGGFDPAALRGALEARPAADGPRASGSAGR